MQGKPSHTTKDDGQYISHSMTYYMKFISYIMKTDRENMSPEFGLVRDRSGVENSNAIQLRQWHSESRIPLPKCMSTSRTCRDGVIH